MILAGVAAGALGGCAMHRAHEASQAQSSMIGLSKEAVLACMGPPASQAEEGATEVWSYESGNGRTSEVGVAGGRRRVGIGASTSTTRSCKVDIVMVQGAVSRVNYSGPTGRGLTQGEQCAYAVDNCLHTAGR